MTLWKSLCTRCSNAPNGSSSWRLRDAIRRIAEHDAALGGYLDATVRTGTYCVYRPV